VKSNHSVALGVLLFVIEISPAIADTGLIGSWNGTFTGVQVEIPVQPGPFGYQSGDSKAVGGPRFVEAELRIHFETDTRGLAAGTWSTGQFSQRFACAQISAKIWNCVDAGGRSSIEITSPSEIKVCYLDARQGAQGAGCAVLRKSAA
jgi:hypothetical protein